MRDESFSVVRDCYLESTRKDQGSGNYALGGMSLYLLARGEPAAGPAGYVDWGDLRLLVD